MKKFLLTLILLAVGLQSYAQTWTKIYENDKDGKMVSGSLEDLKEAVRAGLPIRVGWGNPATVEHVADAKFLTIMKGQIVFAQIDPIFGQTPNMQEGFIELKEGTSWVLIAATNGKSDAMMTEVLTSKVLGHNQRQRAFKWFVQRQ